MPWPRNRRTGITAILAVAGLCYPLLVYVGLMRFSPAAILWLLLALVALRLALTWRKRRRSQAYLTGAVLLVLLGISSVDSETALRFYPVAMSAGLAVIFGWSLISPPTAIERLARLSEPDLPEDGIRYTRKVTWVWLTFFTANGMIAAWTVWFGTLEEWTLYNGLISYLAMGALFTGEYLTRQWVRRKGA